jgi:hypothetical protein
MATLINPFDTYQIFYYGGTAPSPAARIQVYQAGAFTGEMNFFPLPPASVPANTTIAPLGTAVPSLNYELSRFNDVVETLRQEKPLYLFLDTSSATGMLATTDLEPVGEQEGH